MSKSAFVFLVIVALLIGSVIWMGTRNREQPLQKVEKVVPNAALAH
jgi:hypothetical protein